MGNAQRHDRLVLVASVFVVGLCSIVYELLISTTSAYLLGDSVRQFSVTIGTYLAAMGLGSFLARYVRAGRELAAFVAVEIALGLVGGLSVPTLYAYFGAAGYEGFQAVMLATVLLVGTLTGLEIPLLTRLLEPYTRSETALSNVLTLDYVGALAATLLFPFVLLPFVGTFRSSAAFGLVNAGVAAWVAWHFRPRLGGLRWCGAALAAAAALAALGLASGALLAVWRDGLYRDRVVYAETTPYQQIALTRAGDDLRLYLDRVIQWSAVDEYRYHESLVHPALLATSQPPRRVLVLGGGEGLAVREILRHGSVDSVVVVDIDPAIFRLGRDHRQLRELNARALLDPRVRLVAEDAFVYVSRAAGRTRFDAIVADLPDPSTEAVARLYSVAFFARCRQLLAPGGTLVTQATGPYHTAAAFWTVGATVAEAGLADVIPYHAYVPSFGDWGFWLARRGARHGGDSAAPPTAWTLRAANFPTRYFSREQWTRDRNFPPDLPRLAAEPNRLDRPRLLDVYLRDWRRWSREPQVW